MTVAILDHRYRHVPGWTPVDGPNRDKKRDYRDSAAIVAAWAGAQAPFEGYAVDRYGWRPAARPGTTDQHEPAERALAALRNAAIHLGHEMPSARAMTRILDLTRQVTVHTERLAGPFDYLPGLVLRGKELVLAELVKQFEERINGRIGGGGHTVAELTSATSALNRTTAVNDDQRERLLRVGDIVRTEIGKRLAAGAEMFVYCIEIGRQLDPEPHGGVHRSIPVYGEITDETCPFVLGAAKDLQVEPEPPKPDDSLIVSRCALTAAIWVESPRTGVTAEVAVAATRGVSVSGAAAVTP